MFFRGVIFLLESPNLEFVHFQIYILVCTVLIRDPFLHCMHDRCP